MNKLFVLFFLPLWLLATPPDFDPSGTFTFELRKDEWARVMMIEKQTQKKEFFDFRWTLFDHTNIVVHSFFRKFPRHMVMSLVHDRNRYVQTIIPDFINPPKDSVKLYITFVGFKDNLASFRVDLLDVTKRLDVEFIAPPKSTKISKKGS